MNLEKTDRIGELLQDHLKEMVFDELSDSYLGRAGVLDILKDVPVPIRKTELNQISVLKIALNMAFVFGIDPSFKYKENYKKYILKNFDINFANGLVAQGVEQAQEERYDLACISFRGAMQLDPDNANAYYCYGRACKDAYEKIANASHISDTLANNHSAVEDIIGRYKAEAMEAFEISTVKNPELSESYYFLGYAYLNMGLYVKAKLTWQRYLELLGSAPVDTLSGKASEELKNTIEEIRERLAQLDDPVRIEEGYNLILSGRNEEGVDILKNYTEGRFKDWWPLWYYIGTAYSQMAFQAETEFLKASPDGDIRTDDTITGAYEEAVRYYLEVLKLSPSNKETMETLVEIYDKLGNSEKVEKYTRKLEIVKSNEAQDRQLLMSMPDTKLN